MLGGGLIHVDTYLGAKIHTDIHGISLDMPKS